VGSRVCSTFELASLDLLCLASLCPRAASNETESGAKMRSAGAILLFVGLLGVSSAQENPPISQTAPPSVGLEISRPAPVFALTDQFGHEQSNETLKGSKGTVLLFCVRPIGDPSAKRSSCSCKTQNEDLRHKD
jgi:hypothetical protein